MDVDEIIEVIAAGDDSHHAGYDPLGVRLQGRRIRRRRRIVVASVAASAVLTVAAGVVGVTGLPGSGPGDATRSGFADTPGVVLTEWEQEVLDTVPGSYASGGTIVVPGPLDPADDVGSMRFTPSQMARPPVPLGWHGYSDPGEVTSSVTYPPIIEVWQGLEDRTGKDVVADNGAVSLACLTEASGTCSPALVVPGEGEDWLYLDGLEGDSFLPPSSAVEYVTRRIYPRSGQGWVTIGGFGGAGIDRIEVTLVDGSVVEATSSTDVSPGDTLFWVASTSQPAGVTVYDAQGELVISRRRLGM